MKRFIEDDLLPALAAALILLCASLAHSYPSASNSPADAPAFLSL
jgi:hypothetical protein